MKKLLLLMLLIVCSCNEKLNKASNENSETNLTVIKPKKLDISMYPEPKEGYERVIIELEPAKIEYDKLVELYAGKMMSVDCNNHSLVGDFKQILVEGWGYDYWEFTTNGDVMSTMIGCPDNTRTEKFVQVQGVKINYNSRLPIVVYVPKGYKIRYNIWNRSSKAFKAN